MDLPIDGMTCAACAPRLQRVLRRVDGSTARAKDLDVPRGTQVQAVPGHGVEGTLNEAHWHIGTRRLLDGDE